MTTPRSSKVPRHPEVDTTDPLADLRLPDATPVPTVEQVADTLELPGGVFDQAWHDDAATAAVTAWHADDVAATVLHAGGACSCRYLATMALHVTVGVALPVAVEGDEVERDG